MLNVLVSGYIGFDNFGDEAIFYALSNHIKEKNINVSVLCNNPIKVQEKYNVNAYYFKSIKDIVSQLFKTDVLISGGGSLLQNKTSNASLFYYLFIIFLAKLFFKKVVIFSQGIEPIKGFLPNLITKTILKLTDFVSVRDENSLDLMKNWKINATLTSDPVYSLVQDEVDKNKKDILIVQLRECKFINSETIKALARCVFENYNGIIKVFSFQKEYDSNICKEFIDELKNYNVNCELIENKTINETIEIIKSSKYVISTRLHGALIANALGCETFALVYDDKIKNLANELDIQNINLKSYTKEELQNKLQLFFTKTHKAKQFRRYEWTKLDNWLDNVIEGKCETYKKETH